ncbi:DNA-binding transcriptional regulator, XRE-family HTH domain [Evansella caseinilytica]|uniref:DNA-binding transcriptional regulator, XRE-family HTH domain n=1 Tax=Evansella caseinilytica TaxID=1503961 RepID=A0A1H3S4W0_9BACI|nr:DNA-binding transcriptional regulator, XRE-family HTH domain [Evansella caseinilytica]
MRIQRNLKQEELASILNISKSAVSMYERDEREPSFQLVKDIAAFFEVTTDQLLGVEPQRFPATQLLPDNLANSLSDDEIEYLRETLQIYRKMKQKASRANTDKNK